MLQQHSASGPNPERTALVAIGTGREPVPVTGLDSLHHILRGRLTAPKFGNLLCRQYPVRTRRLAVSDLYFG
jgi:hypothetical protein